MVELDSDLTREHIEPLPQTPPKAKPSTASQLQELKELAEQAKANDVDPNMLLFAQLFSKQNQPQPSVSLVRTEPLSKSVGEMKHGEDMFVFLHRFEYHMKLRSVPTHDWLHVLPSLLHGEFSEAYYNNISPSTSFADMRTILLNTGGYSLNDCLNSFPLKFRSNGSKSLMQWFNHWKYKFGVVLEHLSFLSEYSYEDIESTSQILATIGVLAGMTNDSRESVLNRGHTSNHSFVQDCSAMCSYTDYSQKPRHFNSQSYPNSHQGNHGNNSPGRFANARSGNSFNHHNSHTYQPKSHSNSYSTPHSNAQAYPNRPQSPPKRDLNSVTCYKCNNTGHYANNCHVVSPLLPPHQAKMSNKHEHY